MEPPQSFENLSSPAYEPADEFINPAAYRFLPAANPRQNSLIRDSDQGLESAFSRLNLSSDARFLSQPTSFHALQTSFDDGGAASSLSIPPPMAYAGSHHQQALNWAQAPTINGPFGLPGALQEINVGPDFSGRAPYPHAGDPSQLMKFNQRLDFYDADFNDFDLHGKLSYDSYPRTSRYNVPVVPFARKNNFFSSASPLYGDHKLYQLCQHLTPEIMIGNIVFLAKHQVWSSVLALKIEVGLSEQEIDMILIEVMGSWDELLRDQFGSQFVHKLFAVCNEDQRTRVIMALAKFPFMLITNCLNAIGAKAIQKMLENLTTPQQISLAMAPLSSGVFVLASDPNGQHIIHYCVKRFPAEYTKELRENIIEDEGDIKDFSYCLPSEALSMNYRMSEHIIINIAENCFKIATTKSGCCVIQSCVENSRGEARQRLIHEILENVVQLAEDPYGNYVVQHLLGLKMQDITKYLVRQFQGCFASLSCNKYASNVVEKLLQSGDELSATIILELLRSPTASMLLLDPFGNFVIQTALSASKGKVHDALVKFIQVNTSSMQSNLYGKKVLAWFDKKKPYNA